MPFDWHGAVKNREKKIENSDQAQLKNRVGNFMDFLDFREMMIIAAKFLFFFVVHCNRYKFFELLNGYSS